MRNRRVFLALIFILGLTFSLHLMRSHVSSAPDFPIRAIVAGDTQVTIEVPAGASGSDVASLLYENKIVKSSLAFFRVAVSDKRSDRVAPGAHRLTVGISAQQALDQLLDPTRIPNLIKVFEGAWKKEIVQMMKAHGFSDTEIAKGFRAAVLPKGFSESEGLLFPAQYSFTADTNATTVVQAMIDRFTSEETGTKILSAQGKYSPLQMLTIASIVQAEGDAKDFSKVARVIFNRLSISMPLQMDSTVHYIKGSRGQIFLSTTSTLIKSAFNTYKHVGLPPSPIGSPGVAAMNAVLNPAAGDWLYFITVAPGDTRFTRSNDEFVNWKHLYEKNRKAGAFK